jgi:acetylornithine deacetylase
MGHVLVGIERLDRELRAQPRHALLGSGSIHASLIEGGQEYSSYPARCVLQGERRTVPGESVAQVEEELASLLGDVDGEARVTFSRSPFEVGEDEPIVQMLRRRSGGAEIAGAAFWADSGLLADAGIPTVLFGPVGAGAHAEEEWVDTASVERCAQVLLATAEEFCA